MNKNTDLLGQIKVKSQQRDRKCASSYQEGLRDAEEFLRLVGLLSDDLPQKKQLQDEFSAILAQDEESNKSE